MTILESFNISSISTSIASNIVTDILKYYFPTLEKTIVGRLLKNAGLIEPDFEDKLLQTMSIALHLYFERNVDYQLTSVASFFGDENIVHNLGNYILDRKPIDQNMINDALDKHLNQDSITQLLIEKRQLDPVRIIPDFLECYREALNKHLSIPQMAILLEVIDQTDNLIEEIRSSEHRTQQFIKRLLKSDTSIYTNQGPDDERIGQQFNYPPLQLYPKVEQFIGREEILNSFHEIINSTNALCVYGPPGVGKTSLVNQFAWELYENGKHKFPDGILWSNLESECNVDTVLEGILSAYGVESSFSKIRVTAQNLLRHKRALWILDGANHTSSKDLIELLTQLHGSTTMLITSRNSEIFDGNKQELELLSHSHSLTLFQEVSKRGTGHEEQYAAEMCKTLGYLPLAIRIAGRWVGGRAQSKKSLDRLLLRVTANSPLSVLEKVRASFDVSWEDLDDGLRRVFAVICVFAGQDWSISAVSALIDVDIYSTENALDQLVNKCLLDVRSDTRYTAHPLIHEYAREKLANDHDIYWLAAEFYREFVKSQHLRLKSPEIVDATEQIFLELENIQGVWQFAFRENTQRAAKLLFDLLINLWEFLLARGRFELLTDLLDCVTKIVRQFNDECIDAEIKYATASLKMTNENSEKIIEELEKVANTFKQNFLSKRFCEVQIDLACLYLVIGDLVAAEQCKMHALRAAKVVSDSRLHGQIRWIAGQIMYERGLITEAMEQYAISLELFELNNDLLWSNIVRREIGDLHIIKQEPQRAIGYLCTALHFFESIQNVNNLDLTLCGIGDVHLLLKEYNAADTAYHQAIKNAYI